MTPHLDITISGFVQGVSFRYYAAAKAKNLKLTGYVQNQPDGTVYIEAEGDPKALQDFIAWCRQGPRFAQVGKVQSSPGPAKNYSRFEIRL
ncbi:acylphosphatase [Candidatus Amesbacteria bacterium RIFCSPLOWO2_02_FULL_48_11]|uniref:Acylphosphatase n=5 Tax=Candidatus Amesiibacteriota TaxID=1752730 RepID=A0A1F4Z4U2_9BACT|nr:MAG: Acylphosphatase [Candidatus Amesbacteria bacterium GW2011_GWA2_47_11]KKU95113.1 MAG: Acylphosphatase [Candidatus Amesbacteria bacterium GW2011_GWC1_48_10]KKW00195.1 MAG: Acylphosphatase [Candidatus Amesbacteria bacterium GW2011_GWA1_48_9]OGC90453.1 MAG: acylphosphatase [Candidatus Amesbacteria bacterium RBG_19FT_COMBO_48_16]OGC95920.1 MAG: acylphosphatase [Candidatus Amesbacteria bacterium RIFCSPHIGHO2_02_FULL_48_21]OGC98852.1 MAG: acylphosphatase [Candidatus Amesbacteria bacterium RBG